MATSIGLTFVPQPSPLTITAIPSSGVQPLEVTIEVETFIANPAANYRWDTNGDGTIDQSGPTLSAISAVYQNPGFYFPKVTVTDTLGNQHEETTIINVISATDIDALLRALWTIYGENC